MSEPAQVWRDSSPPAFTADAPHGTHAAWFVSFNGKDYGPYFMRREADHVAKLLTIGSKYGPQANTANTPEEL